jgi:hypothetical protein
MGRIIQQNNGKTTVYITGENINNIPVSTNTYYLGVDLTTGLYEKLNPSGAIINLESSGGGSFTGGTVNGATNFTNGLSANTFSATTYLNLPGDSVEVTYSELVDKITGETLSTGSYYIITDFQTCYDQPDFDYNGGPIISGNYKQGPVEPIIVFATSANTISSIAYQSAYPNDTIKYDWSWDMTEVTNGAAFGRITERVDEFNNRTDYDHRNILFKRYRLFTQREGLRINGTIQLLGDGTVNGTDTTFTGLTVGDVIYIPSTNPSFYEILSISGDTLMSVSGDTIGSVGLGTVIYKTIEETNDSNGYFSFKRTNVKTDDFIEYTTFGDATSNDYAKNNYIGNYANNYTNIDSGTFILANNVFLEGQYESNKFGDYCYNNTFGTDNQNNVWGDWCYENVSVNDIDDCIIGHYFNRNLINANLTSNHIGNDFNNNRLLNENGTDFEDNIIGNGFSDNLIYSGFYKNKILDNFNNNVIGDFGNLDNFEFYRNYIRNNFNNNIIRQDFQNNQIGTNYQQNTINGDSQGNTILNGFNNNTIGSYFSVNDIGDDFNNNTVNDSFNENTTKYSFYNNVISNQFNTNDIGTNFYNNNPSNLDLFGWNDLSTVSTRTYDTFYNSLNGDFGKILGKELVMEVTSTSQYFKIKFTQWSTNDNGFQYTREEIDSSGNTLGPVITFTLVNGGTDVDYIVPGDVEITRSGTDPIYNSFAEPGWGSSVSPSGTSWNSIYTEPNNGLNFAYNKIGNEFQNNTIGNDFGFGGSQNQGNVINEAFQFNTIGGFMYNNVIGNDFTNNTIGDNFENNAIKNYFASNTVGDVFESNTIGDFFNTNTIGDNFESNTIKNYFIGNSIENGFESNEIGNYFGNDGSGIGAPVQNIIFDDFKYNNIGNFFGNDTNFPSVGGGTNGDGGNIINTGFQFNVIGDNVLFNALNLNFTNNKIGNDFWFNVFGQNTSDNTIGNLFVGNSGISGFPTEIGDNFISNNLGNYSSFNEIDTNFQYNKIGHFFGNAGSGTQNIISTGFTNNNIGNYFGDDGSNTSGGNNIGVNFTLNKIGSLFYSNTIGDDFNNNIVGNESDNNTVGTNFSKNNISNGFFNNNIGNYFFINTVGDNFNGNTVGNSTFSNTVGNDFFINTVGDNFRRNQIECSPSSIDFTTGPATHVYGDYNCIIFKRPDSTLRLSYYDNSDVLNITNIDA